MCRGKDILAAEYIIFVPEVEAFGGAERSVLALCRWLRDQSMRHRVLLYYDRIGFSRYAGYDLKITELSPPPQALKKVVALRNYFAAQPEDAPKPLMSGIQAALHASLAGIKGFHTLMHDTPSLASDEGRIDTSGKWLRRKFSDLALCRGLRSGGRTIVTSNYLKQECFDLYGGDVVISRMGGLNGKNTFRLRPVERQLRMLSVSRVENNKRIDWILRSLAVLESRQKPLSHLIDWRLDIVGMGSQIIPLRAMSDKLGINDRVVFHGFVPDEKLEALYESAHLFLMPARQGYGIPAVEALYRGIPVLVHRESGVSDILLDTSWCVIMEGGEENMTNALEKSITNLVSRKHFSAPLPAISSEAEWAEQVARHCSWIV